jgi:hypothetical protein
MKYYVYGAKVVYSTLSANSFTGLLDKTGQFVIKTGGLEYERGNTVHRVPFGINDYFCGVFNRQNR